MRSASRSASRCAAISSISLRRSAISRSRAVNACSSAWIALARTASEAAIADERSCDFLAMSMAFWISAISIFWSRSMPRWRSSRSLISRASSMPRSVAMRARSTSSAEAISASSKAWRLAICSASSWRSRSIRTPSMARSWAMRAVSVSWLAAISARRLSPSALVSSIAFSASAIWRSSSTISSASLRWISSSLCVRSRWMRAFSISSSSAICSRSVFSRVFISASSSERRRAISRRCVSSSVLMRSSEMLRSCASRDFSTASREINCACSAFLVAERALAHQLASAGRRGGSRPRVPAPAAHIRSRGRSPAPSCWVSRFWLRMSTSVRCSISLRIRRRFSIDSVSCVRPSASKALDGSKYSRLVWSRSTIATLSSSSPLSGQRLAADLAHAAAVVAALLVHLLQRHLRGDGAHRRRELAFQQFANAFGLQRAAAERLRGGGDQLRGWRRRARRTRR